MDDVKPWEPVRYSWLFKKRDFKQEYALNINWGPCEWEAVATKEKVKSLIGPDRMYITLANGQRIIVRAKS
jgi:hypothetical protein